VCGESVRNIVCEGVFLYMACCVATETERQTERHTLHWQLAPCSSSAWQESARVHVACCARMSEGSSDYVAPPATSTERTGGSGDVSPSATLTRKKKRDAGLDGAQAARVCVRVV
jgi:hypothetical protein